MMPPTTHPTPRTPGGPTAQDRESTRAPARSWRGAWAALGLALGLGACGGGGADGTPPASPPPPAPVSTEDLVVRLRPGTEAAAWARAQGLQLVDQFGRRPIWRVRTGTGDTPTAALQRLAVDPAVLFAEPNAESGTPEGRRVSVWAVGGSETAWATQWAPEALRLPQAHALGEGLGVRVAVLDTGMALDHPVLAPRLARDAGGRALGRDFVDDDADPAEAGTRADAGFGHGTHVAGLVVLAAPQARLMPLRVLDAAGRGNAWVLAEALAWAMDPDGNPATDDGAHVINLSVGTTTPTRLLDTVTRLAACADDDDDDAALGQPGFEDDSARCLTGQAAVVVAAAGNGGSDTEFHWPAAEAVKGLLAVTASRADARLADFANRGPWIHVAAPGENVISTVPGGGWGTWSGTSMATPLAAGAAALLLATPAPSGDPARSGPRQWLPETVTQRLAARTQPLCGTALRQIDARAALADESAPDRVCP